MIPATSHVLAETAHTAAVRAHTVAVRARIETAITCVYPFEHVSAAHEKAQLLFYFPNPKRSKNEKFLKR